MSRKRAGGPRPCVIFIVGPTSSGKSAVAAGVAERVNGEVISCDSMQVYKGMDVITRPPSEGLPARVRHHLVKTLSPSEEFSAARFVEEAGRIIDDIIARGKMPVVTGGTGLYMKSLIDGLFSSPPADEEFRESMRKTVEERGGEYLYAKLKQVDPETAARLHPNDTRRIIRALEVYHLTGETIRAKKSLSRGISEKYDCRIFGLDMPRKALYARINGNVEKMFSEGITDEVRRLLDSGLSLTAGKALGIKEVKAFLDGGCTLEEAKEELKKNTRRYAKRQLTWFRADNRVTWLNADREAGEIAEEIAARCDKL
ncbi:MAG: tRNA (adenosine(37)-N6)-dimethylallyltransferase MiaA [Candidatus Omnitrophota bacterium]